MHKTYRLEAEYYKDFRCKCGACRHTCCGEWNIAVSMEEYYRLIGLDCSADLHRRLEAAFMVPGDVSPDHFRVIAPNWLGYCPMLSEDGLCSLQVECGEKLLPYICRMYPRGIKSVNGQAQACCSSSCERVIELLMETDQLRYLVRSTEDDALFREAMPADWKEKSGHCAVLLRDRTMPLQDRIAAICEYLTGSPLPASDAGSGFEQVTDALENMTDNSRTLRYTLDDIRKNGIGSASALKGWLHIFENRFPEWERWFENALLNHILYMDFPFADHRIDEASACRGLCLTYACMRYFCAGLMSDAISVENVVDSLACCFHLIEHTPFYYNANILVRDMSGLLTL